MKFLSLEKLSAHKFKDSNGQLICTDCVLARTGKQTYTKREVFGDSTENPYSEIQLDRKPEQVFSGATLASFENKPVTIEHPNENVNTDNYKKFAVGFVRDVHKGVYTDEKGEAHDVIMGTIVLTDKHAIQLLEDGEENFLSCGYDCDITTNDKNADYAEQINIRGNHIAMCANPRAGFTQIFDSIDNRGILASENLPSLGAWINKTNKNELVFNVSTNYSNKLHMTYVGNRHYSLSKEARECFRDILNKVKVYEEGNHAIMMINGLDNKAEELDRSLYDFFWNASCNRNMGIFDISED